ncbi:hypothetical protein [Streptomyces radicis]|uniref:Type VI secretion protein n=1 Tax=Streptomyces radicis TaxID=1750517 RepID=A0A3A9VX28_9ACTN|nr:hypothetical protein [Streptomyces radicis]RKN05575.1 hypothetical protein D7319_25215 [Streptomyces radicis]RKN17444.1 hypothetical protein D7318_24580 [Streptomyces radicis]
MAYDRHARGGPPRDPAAPERHGGGVPDALLVGSLAFLVGASVLTWTATGLAGLLRHGAWPDGVTFVHTARAIRSLLTAPGDVAAAWPDAPPAQLPSAAMLWLMLLVQLVLLFSAVLVVSIRVATWRARRAIREAERHRPPDLPEQAHETAPLEAVPTPSPTPTPAPDPVRDETAAVLAAPAGLIVRDPDGSLHASTARQRGRLGPVHVYDPEHLTDAAARLRWAPERGCDDMAVARRRASQLLAPIRPSEPIFRLDAEAAETLLRCYLHAAALSGNGLTHVHRWAHGRSSGEPAKVLRAHPRAAGGASMELESTLTSHPVRRDAALVLIGRALNGLDQLHIRQACAAGRADTLALANLAGEGATLFVVGDQRETAGLRGALVDALVAEQPTLEVSGVEPSRF